MFLRSSFTRFGRPTFARVCVAGKQINQCRDRKFSFTGLDQSSLSNPLFTTQTNYFCNTTPKETNMLETIKKWEQEAKIEDLNLVTEKLGIDKQKYKEVSLQLNDIITLRTKLQGSQHLDTIYANGILAAVYRVIGKHKSAANIIQQCLSIIESMLLGNDEIPKDFTKKDLLFLYAACVEEFGRIFLAFEKAELALESVQHGISVIESQMDPQSVDDFKVHLAVLHKVLAEIQFSLGRLEEARDSISKSDKVIGKIGNDLVWRYRLLNHWQGKSANKFRNCLLGAKIHSRLMDFSGAEKYLEDAWTIAAKDTGRMSIECCNAYIELVDFYAKLIPSEISAEDFVRLLAQGLTVTRATDSVLRKTRGVDKRIIFPYYPMIQRGLRTLLTVDERKDISIALLFECLRIHEKYPSIYPTTNDDIFRKVMTLVQLLREEREYTRALDLVTKYKEKFKSLKTKEVGAVISLIEIQAQLIISVCYGDEPPVPNTSSGRVPLSQQMAITTQTRDAVEGLEYVVTYYSKNKNTEATIKSLHTLAIVETLQEEFSYADRECHRCIKLIDPSFVEYEDYIELAESKIAPHHFGRLSDLFILRGTILRVQHDPKRALNHYKVALKLLSTPRSEKNLRLQDEITRTYDMLRCLGFMIDISKSTLSEHEEVNDTEKIAETKEFLKVCKANYNTVSAELDKLKGVQKPRSHSL